MSYCVIKCHELQKKGGAHAPPMLQLIIIFLVVARKIVTFLTFDQLQSFALQNFKLASPDIAYGCSICYRITFLTPFSMTMLL